MPIKSKKDKRKKKKGRLTNEEILKLIKKLKPKNQQTVRINIGDKEDKKKGAVSNQPPVRSEVSYFRAPPQTDFFQPPQPPLLINKPPPSLAETKKILDAPTQEEKQEQATSTRLKKRRKPKPLQQEEFMSDEPILPISYFQEPDKFKKSVLGENASRPLRYANPVENDRFQPEIIQTIQSQDQVGNRSSFNMSSDTWTLTPEGNIQSVEEIQKAQQGAPEEAPPNEEELIQQQTDLLTEGQMIFETSEESEAVPTNISLRDVNRLIIEGKLDLAQFQIDPNVVYKTGKKKGQLRKEITSRDLAPILQTIDKQGIE